ncbi:GreA/GreB family elongation factor [Maribacter antarcticus]|uniref:GreA/GreB family elongation factor n=1 Tax=Maribacter antarcticus TaxID=505250 RepID=UPI00055D6A2F|nr:GreA/GreB family elongation factor [Maribacter antarcticus]
MRNNDQLRELKEAAFKHCQTFVTERLGRLNSQAKEISDALTSETKSSAGDKHETGRAMLQLEREKLGIQLADAEIIQALLHKVPANVTSASVGLGTMVKTTTSTYFIAISAGECAYENQKVFCISPATPIGKLVMGKQIGDSFTFQSKENKLLIII